MNIITENPELSTYIIYIILGVYVILQWMQLVYLESCRKKILPLRKGIIGLTLIIFSVPFWDLNMFHISFCMVTLAIVLIIGAACSLTTVSSLSASGNVKEESLDFMYNKNTKFLFTWLPCVIVFLFFISVYSLELWR